ncbi:MAG: hypothetical protein ACF8PN_02675 [Phycisphaerales bacterium]
MYKRAQCSVITTAICGAMVFGMVQRQIHAEPCDPVDVLVDFNNGGTQSEHGKAVAAQGVYIAVLDPKFNAGGFTACSGSVSIWKPDPENDNSAWVVDSVFDDDDIGVASRIGEQGGEYAPGRRHLAAAGDVDLDGHPDWVVSGVYSCNSSPLPVDAVWVFTVASGSACGAAPQLKAMITSDSAGATLFGRSVDGAGDVDGDGASDIVVGAPQGSGTGGEARVYWDYQCVGGNGSFASSYIISGPPSEAAFASEVRFISDIDGDGRDEVAIGDPSRHQVEIYAFNPSTSTFALHSTITPPPGTVSSKFGSVINHYATSDPNQPTMVLIGDPRFYSGPDQIGAVYAYKWNTTTSSWAHQGTLFGEEDFDWFGSSIASAGSFGGGGASGSDNFVVGASGATRKVGVDGIGEVIVFDGDTFTEVARHGGEKWGDESLFGHSVAATDTGKEVGIVVGAPQHDDGSFDGRAYWIPDIVSNRRTMALFVYGISTGQDTTFQVAGADPHEKILLAYSLSSGCTGTASGARIELFNPTQAAIVTATANGFAQGQFVISGQYSGQELIFQAVQHKDGSNPLSSNVNVMPVL